LANYDDTTALAPEQRQLYFKLMTLISGIIPYPDGLCIVEFGLYAFHHYS